MKSKKLSLSEIKNVLNRDEMKKVIGGCGNPCTYTCSVGGFDTCIFFGPNCGPCVIWDGETGYCSGD